MLNGSGVGGQAGVVFDALKGAGFAVVDPPGNADRNDYDVTEVRYVEGSDDLAKYTKAYLGGAGKLVEVDTLPAGTNVELVLGRDFTQVKSPVTTTPGATDHARPGRDRGSAANPGGDGTVPPAGC